MAPNRRSQFRQPPPQSHLLDTCFSTPRSLEVGCQCQSRRKAHCPRHTQSDCFPDSTQHSSWSLPTSSVSRKGLPSRSRRKSNCIRSPPFVCRRHQVHLQHHLVQDVVKVFPHSIIL